MSRRPPLPRHFQRSCGPPRGALHRGSGSGSAKSRPGPGCGSIQPHPCTRALAPPPLPCCVSPGHFRCPALRHSRIPFPRRPGGKLCIPRTRVQPAVAQGTTGQGLSHAGKMGALPTLQRLPRPRISSVSQEAPPSTHGAFVPKTVLYDCGFLNKSSKCARGRNS